MNEINQIASLTPAATATSTASDRVASEDFFRVLSAQISTQNPLEPMDENQFLSQMAQFTQLEETLTTNDQLRDLTMLQENIAAIQQMTQGSSLIGQSIEYIDPTDSSEQSGDVQAVRVQNGLVVADLGNGKTVPLPWITAVLGPDATS